MINNFLYLAASEAHSSTASEGGGDLLSALGIDATLLLLQSLAFLVLVFVLGKFVYPHLLKAIESRRDSVEESMNSAKKAEKKLAEVEKKVDEIISNARSEAREIVSSSKKEATSIIGEAESKAVERAEKIVENAKTKMDSEVEAAKEAMRKETVEMVAQAAELVIRDKVDASKDSKLIRDALKEVS